MRGIVALTIFSALGWATMAVGAEPAVGGSRSVTQSLVRGRVSDVDQKPVSGAEIVLLTETGQEVARAKTDAVGGYSLGCVDLGKYQHRVTAPGYEGQTVVAPLGPNGLTVSWALDPNKPALASAIASGGPCAGGVVAGASGTAGPAGPAGSSGTAGPAGPAGTGGDGTAALTLGGAAIAGGVGVGIASGVGAFGDSVQADTPAQ